MDNDGKSRRQLESENGIVVADSSCIIIISAKLLLELLLCATVLGRLYVALSWPWEIVESSEVRDACLPGTEA